VWKPNYEVGHVVMDITGGTNTMVSGAYRVAEDIGLKTYYLGSAEYDPVFRMPRPATNFYREFLPDESWAESVEEE
jgi:hypothetical protein